MKNNYICHFCGLPKEGLDPNKGSWWNLHEYRDHFTGLACPTCFDVITAKTPDQIEAEKTAAAVAETLTTPPLHPLSTDPLES